MCAGAGGYWFSRTQKCVKFLTIEAEEFALGDTIKEAMLIRYLSRFIFLGLTCMAVLEDKEVARHPAQNLVCTSNSKHIDV